MGAPREESVNAMRFPASLLLLASLILRAQSPDVSGLPARHSPDWVRDAVIYEVFPRQFSPTGDFKGITNKLDDLQKLGVTILWLMPIHPNGVLKHKGEIGSPYAVRDYYAINPAYGTDADLKKLVAEAHRRGLKVILDTVPNHTSWDSVMMKDKSFYKQDAAGNVISPNPDWSDVAGLNYANPKLREYMTTMLVHWLRGFDLDGYRCDVASGVPVDYWNEARLRLDAAKSDIVMLAEASQPDLLVKAFDLDYAWPMHSALTDVLENGKPASTLQIVWEEQRAKFPRGALHMYFSDNHDEKRAIARFGEKGALAGSAFVFTLDGVPMLYNGMEVGDTTESGAPALFEKLPVFWPIVERRPEFARFYEEMIALRKQHPALRRGELIWLDNSDLSSVVTFLRKTPSEEVLVAINMTNRPFEGSVTHRGAKQRLSLAAWGWQVIQK